MEYCCVECGLLEQSLIKERGTQGNGSGSSGENAHKAKLINLFQSKGQNLVYSNDSIIRPGST